MKQEFLKNMTTILTNKDFTINADGPLLASYIKHLRGDTLLDLCTGNGIIPVWLLDRGFIGDIVALDIQEEAISLLQKTIELNAFRNISAINEDLKKYNSSVKFDIVCCNPPYYDKNNFVTSPKQKRIISRSTVHADIRDVVDCAKRNLKDNGSFYCCFTPSGEKSLYEALSLVNLNKRRIQFVRFSETRPPWLMLVHAEFGEELSIEILPEFVVEKSGVRNIDFDNIYIEGRQT